MSEDEVKYLVREGVSHGVFEHQESELVHRVFQFTDTPVRAVMVPRPRILALDLDTPPGEVLTRAVAHSRSRFPVVRGSIDNTVGVVVIKDLLRCAAEGKPAILAQLLHPPLFIPESARTGEVLRTLQQQHRTWPSSSTSTDGPSGWSPSRTCSRRSWASSERSGSRAASPICPACPTARTSSMGPRRSTTFGSRPGCRSKSSPEYQTLAGFLIHALHTVPQPGVSVEAHGFVWTVVDMEGARIAKVKAERKGT